MKRLILPWAAFAVALCLALPASAANGRSVKGVITALSSDAVAVRSANSIVTTCAVTQTSPSLESFAAGDRVMIVCRGRHHGRFVLQRIRHLSDAPPASPSNESEPVTFGGAITALTDTAISLHDGDRDLTCSIDSSSPSTADYKVGQHARVTCVGGRLVAITATGGVGRYFVGTLSALDVKSITVQTVSGPVTCTIGDGSPSTRGFTVGDRVGMGCRASTMQLVLLKKVDGDGTAAPPPPPAPPTSTTVGARGSVSALSDSSVSVQTDGGTVTCGRGPSSPSLGDTKVGDHVAMKCVDGVIVAFEHVT